MVLTLIILALVGAVVFFHYVQGFFSATISAMLTVLSAVLAISYHEKFVDMLLGGRFADTAHAMALSGLFFAVYGLLRIAFDKMIPGNVRFPVMVDKIGGAAMGVVAGIFVGGIVAIVAQYMPLQPAVAGYARYAVHDRQVIVPAEAVGGRSLDSETWDELKTQKAGGFEESDKQKMLVPMDDIVVNTVEHLSDGGSLGWNRPLNRVHPDLLTELFGQRLGIQGRAVRVVPKDAISSVDLFRIDAIDRRDHEYKDLRARPFEMGNFKPASAQLLVVARVMFSRSAIESDLLIRWSPGAVRLVARQGTGADAEWVNYFPIGTVDEAKLLYTNAPDDYMFGDAKGGEEIGIDFAFLVNRAGFAEGGNSPNAPLVVAEGTFLEFKRLAREDLGGKKIQPQSAYKANPKIKVFRKKRNYGMPGQPQQPQQATADPSEDLKAKLVGNWAGSSDTGQILIEFRDDGSLTFTNTPTQGVPQVGQGTWEVNAAKTTADTLVINRTVGGATAENVIKFTDDSNMTLTSGNRTLNLQKR